jgi:hypothetical protein
MRIIGKPGAAVELNSPSLRTIQGSGTGVQQYIKKARANTDAQQSYMTFDNTFDSKITQVQDMYQK